MMAALEKFVLYKQIKMCQNLSTSSKAMFDHKFKSLHMNCINLFV